MLNESDYVNILIILPPFFPTSEVDATIRQILPEAKITTSTEFEKDESEVLVATTFTKVDESLISKMPKLKFVQIASTGYDNVDKTSLRKRKIRLANIPTANKESVAEHVITMALAQLKNLLYFHNEIMSGNWPFLTNSAELMGKSFGIIGMGAIGKRLAERLLYFGTNTIYFDPVRIPEEEEENLGVAFAPMEELLRKSDIISLHVPLTEDTAKFIGEEQFKAMKDGAIFINTARGEIVDETAMVGAIKSKGIRACIDVYANEPPDPSSELLKAPNVLFSPHIAGVTVESQQRFITDTIANVLKYAQGLEPSFLVL